MPSYQLGDYYAPIDARYGYWVKDKGFNASYIPPYLLIKTADFNIATHADWQSTDNQVYLSPYYSNKYQISPAISMDMDAYAMTSFDKSARSLWDTKVQDLLKNPDRRESNGLFGEYQFKLPKQAMTKTMRKLLGDKVGSLSLDGSQRLSFSGTSTVHKDNQIDLDEKQNFDFSMRQDLNLQLKGTIGEKIHVNVNHQSTNGSSDNPNTIEIEYKGDEDEIVQSIKGGDVQLSLTGSQFISTTASSEGLFGIKGEFKLGDLKLTSIISKEEGEKNNKKYNGNAEADSTIKRSKDYVNYKYYYVADPALIYQLSNEDSPKGYKNNAIMITEKGEWDTTPGYPILPREGTLKVYLDNYNDTDDTTVGAIAGHEAGQPNGTEYHFEILEAGTDYDVDYDSGLIIFSRTITKSYIIGVTYTQNNGVQVGNPSENNLQVKIIQRYNVSSSTEDTWKYQARNIYSWGSTNTKSDGFKLTVYSMDASDNIIYNVPSDISSSMTYNDYLRLDTNNDGLINSEDNTINLAQGYVFMPFIEPFKAFSDSVVYEDDYIDTDDTDQLTAYIKVKGKVGRDQISLDQINILKGSVKVKVDGETMQEGQDYVVDYDMGVITFLSAKGRDSDAAISIDYEYKPTFSVESRTLMGLRADYEFSDSFKLGSTLIYHSEKMAEERPRIGNEDKTLFLGDLDGSLKFQPDFFTRMIDWLPLIETDADSKFELSGEVAGSYAMLKGAGEDSKEAYVDDMESSVDTYPLGTTWKSWSFGSRPYLSNLPSGRINWYTDSDRYRMSQVYNNHENSEDKNEYVSVMSCRLYPPDVQQPGMNNLYWTGLMKYVGNQLDFSQKKYIEVLVKVENPDRDNTSALPRVIMHVDLGDMNEDFYTQNGGLGVLNREDGVKYRTSGGSTVETALDGTYAASKDVGLDMVPNGGTNLNHDVTEDLNDESNNNKDSNGDYPHLNGTEKNGELDTEDLDGNGSLNTLERYFEYSVDLAGMDYISVTNDGWRLYQIPVQNNQQAMEVSNASTSPDLTKVSYVRVWFETDREARVNFATLDLVGNKWIEKHIRSYSDQIFSSLGNETVTVGMIDNKNYGDSQYAPPPNSYTTKDGEQTLEQAITVKFENLQPDNYGMVRQKLLENINLLGYNRIRFWYYQKSDDFDSGNGRILFRLGADSLDYYEVSCPILADNDEQMSLRDWHQVDLDFSSFTYLTTHTDPADSNTTTRQTWNNTDVYVTKHHDSSTGYIFTKVSRVGQSPSLSTIKEISLGVVADSTSSQPYNGTVYFDDIRVKDPYNEPGYAAQATMNIDLADFISLSANLNRQSMNFQTIKARSSSTPRYEDKTSLSLSGKCALNKLLPTSWGMNLPLNATRTTSVSIPRFKNNSDILRSDLSSKEKAREKTQSETDDFRISISQAKTPANRWLAYTIKNITLNGGASLSKTQSSTAADTTWTFNADGSYNLTIPRDKLGYKLFGNYTWYFMPAEYRNSLKWKYVDPHSWRWETTTTTDPLTQVVTQQTDKVWVDGTKSTRTVSTSNTVTYQLFSDIKLGWQLDTKRDLNRTNHEDKRITMLGTNVGMETDRSQSFSLDWQPAYFSDFVTTSSNLDIDYTDNQRQTNSTLKIYQFEGGVNRTISTSFTLKNKEMTNNLLDWIFGSGVGGEGPAYHEPDQIDSDFDKTNGKSGSKDTYKSDDTGKKDVKPEPPAVTVEDEPAPKPEDKEPSPDQVPIEEAPPSKTPQGAVLFDDADSSPVEEEPVPPKKGKKDKKADREQDEEGVRDNTPFTAKFFRYIARLEDIELTYSNSYSSHFEARDNRPPFAYQLGLPHTLEKDGELESDVLSSKNNDDSFRASSGFPVMENLDTRLEYSHSITRVYSGSCSKSVETVFPSMRTTLSNVQKYLPFISALKSSQLTNSYTNSIKENGTISWSSDKWPRPNTTITSVSFSPLLGWQARWNHDINTEVSYGQKEEVNTTHRDDASQNNVLTSTTKSIDASLDWTYNSETGFTVPFTTKRIIIKNDLDSSLDFSYERTHTERKNANNPVQVDVDQMTYSIKPGVSYEFSKDIKGGLNSEYKKVMKYKEEEEITTFSLEIWVEIQF